jgi:hypothetical protein
MASQSYVAAINALSLVLRSFLNARALRVLMFCCHSIPFGVPRSVARSITGDKTESMYLRYRAVRRDEQDEALAKIAAPTQ